MPLETLTMIRHGESTGNVARAVALREGAEVMDIPERDADVPLSELGRGQAAALGDRLAGLERPGLIVASSFLRARETAEIALKASGSPAITLDERLRDREGGLFYGLTWTGITNRHPDEAARLVRDGKFYYRPPGGESWADVALRLRAFLAELDGTVLVFAHDVIIVLARYILEGLTEAEVMELEKTPVSNCSISRWERGRLVLYNDVSHL